MTQAQAKAKAAPQTLPEASAGATVTVQSVSQSFSVEEETTVALDDVSFTVPYGQFTAIVGPSGCGKSTLLSLIAGLRRPDSGALLCGDDEIVKPMPQKIGMIFQEANLLPWLSAIDNVAFPLKLRRVPKAERLAAAADMLKLTGLDGFEDRLPHQLSGGMKQRVSIARGLVQNPGVLLMDEPFASLDEQTRMVLGDEVLRIWAETGKTILFVTHSLSEAVYLSDRIIVLTARPGRIVDDVHVDLPRPRTFAMTSSERFGLLKDRIWGHIRTAER
jgi:NitT/TauT family transport system ATP-binding protein